MNRSSWSTHRGRWASSLGVGIVTSRSDLVLGCPLYVFQLLWAVTVTKALPRYIGQHLSGVMNQSLVHPIPDGDDGRPVDQANARRSC